MMRKLSIYANEEVGELTLSGVNAVIIGRIEIASKEYWKWMMQGDAELYCTLLFIGDKNDWRMIKDAEEMKYIRDNYIVDYVHELSNTYMLGSFFNGQMGYVVPVRDI